MSDPTHVSEESNISFPLKTLVSVLGATAIAVSGYLSVTNRITVLERRTAADEVQIKENEQWINNFQPPAAVQDTVRRVRDLEIKIAILETIIKDR